jgi:LysR family transcriptional regulator, transcriptional activator of nhaA
MNWLNYHHLYYFWMVAREGSVTRAAEKLFLSQPTVSNQLQELEKTAGQKLFTRSGRNLVLTEMGQIIYRYADEIFSIGQELQQFLSGSANADRPMRLKIGVTDSLPKLVTYQILEPLMRYESQVQFVCMEDDNLDGLLQRLSRFELDLVLADAPIPSGSTIKAYNHLLGESGVSFLGSKDLYQKYGKNFPHSLHTAPLLLPSHNTALRREIDDWLSVYKLEPKIIAEFDDMALLKVFGQKGHGIICLPSIMEEDLLKELELEVFGRDDAIKNSFYAISIERKIRNSAVAHLIETARQSLFQKA